MFEKYFGNNSNNYSKLMSDPELNAEYWLLYTILNNVLMQNKNHFLRSESTQAFENISETDTIEEETSEQFQAKMTAIMNNSSDNTPIDNMNVQSIQEKYRYSSDLLATQNDTIGSESLNMGNNLEIINATGDMFKEREGLHIIGNDNQLWMPLEHDLNYIGATLGPSNRPVTVNTVQPLPAVQVVSFVAFISLFW